MQSNDNGLRNWPGAILAAAFAGAMFAGLHSTANWACALRQQMEVTVPHWIPQLILQNVAVVCRWIR